MAGTEAAILGNVMLTMSLKMAKLTKKEEEEEGAYLKLY